MHTTRSYCQRSVIRLFRKKTIAVKIRRLRDSWDTRRARHIQIYIVHLSHPSMTLSIHASILAYLALVSDKSACLLARERVFLYRIMPATWSHVSQALQTSHDVRVRNAAAVAATATAASRSSEAAWTLTRLTTNVHRIHSSPVRPSAITAPDMKALQVVQPIKILLYDRTLMGHHASREASTGNDETSCLTRACDRAGIELGLLLERKVACTAAG